jgi:hypothetical protein
MPRNKLLLDESPLVVLPTLAKVVGLEESILLQQIHYWLPKSHHAIYGVKWVRKTYQEWHEEVPFMTPKQVRDALNRLEQQCVIVGMELSKNRSDRTKYYTICYVHLEELTGHATIKGTDDFVSPSDNSVSPSDEFVSSRGDEIVSPSDEKVSSYIIGSTETTSIDRDYMGKKQSVYPSDPNSQTPNPAEKPKKQQVPHDSIRTQELASYWKAAKEKKLGVKIAYFQESVPLQGFFREILPSEGMDGIKAVIDAYFATEQKQYHHRWFETAFYDIKATIEPKKPKEPAPIPLQAWEIDYERDMLINSYEAKGMGRDEAYNKATAEVNRMFNLPEQAHAV